MSPPQKQPRRDWSTETDDDGTKTTESLGEELVEAAAAQAPSEQIRDLQKALQDCQKRITELASENAALTEQMATKEASWVQEKERILKALKSERLLRKEAQKELKMKEKEDLPSQQTPSNQEETLRTTSLASENAALKEQMASKESIWTQEKEKILKALKSERAFRRQVLADIKAKQKEKDETIGFLQQRLVEERNDGLSVKHQWSTRFNEAVAFYNEECKKIRDAWENELNIRTASFKEELTALSSDWETRWLQEALKEKNHSIQSEAEPDITLNALVDLIKHEQAAKEERLKREQELQKRSRQMEEDWSNNFSQSEEAGEDWPAVPSGRLPNIPGQSSWWS